MFKVKGHFLSFFFNSIFICDWQLILEALLIKWVVKLFKNTISAKIKFFDVLGISPFLEKKWKMGLLNVILQLGPSWATFFCLCGCNTWNIIQRNYIERGVIRSNMDFFQKKQQRKTFFKAKNHFFSANFLWNAKFLHFFIRYRCFLCIGYFTKQLW